MRFDFTRILSRFESFYCPFGRRTVTRRGRQPRRNDRDLLGHCGGPTPPTRRNERHRGGVRHHDGFRRSTPTAWGGQQTDDADDCKADCCIHVAREVAP